MSYLLDNRSTASAALAAGIDIATPPLVSCWGRRPMA
jgi:hypothetical protein